MYKIKYKNNEPIPEIKIIDGEEETIYKENIVDLEYSVYTLEDKDKWLDIIQKSYGKWGNVTIEENNEEKPMTELERLQADNLTFAEALAELQYQNDIKDFGGTI